MSRGCRKKLEFLEGGGYSLWAVFGKSRGEGGSYEKSLPWVGYGYFLEPHSVDVIMNCDK